MIIRRTLIGMKAIMKIGLDDGGDNDKQKKLILEKGNDYI